MKIRNLLKAPTREQVFEQAKKEHEDWDCQKHPDYWLDLTAEEKEAEIKYLESIPCTCGKKPEVLWDSPAPEEYPNVQQVEGNVPVFHFGIIWPDTPDKTHIVTYGPQCDFEGGWFYNTKTHKEDLKPLGKTIGFNMKRYSCWAS